MKEVFKMDIETKVKNIIQDQLNVSDEMINKGEMNLVEDLGADSLDIVELLMTFEEEFNIEITDKDISERHLDTINAAIDLVKVKLPKNK